MMASKGNAYVFRFENDNLTLRNYLNTAERARVRSWQPGGSRWSIELHSGHPQGQPFYIRLDGNTDSENVPKADTLNHLASEFNVISGFKNWEKLKAGLSSTAQTALLLFVRQNWDLLTLIAQRYWTNTVAPPDPLPPTPRAATKPCNVPNCTGVVQNVTSGKAACSVCWTYQ
jgi:hypothetical protein